MTRIEFNDELRWIDVASDMAFAWMDLLSHDRPGLANVLLSAWLDASGDVSASTVWSFFASYRAGVRAKIAAIRMKQLGGPDASPEAAACLMEARRYLALAQRIAQPGAPPQLIITHGLSGSGKSRASGRWLANEPSGRAIRLRSDVERKRLQRHECAGPQRLGLERGHLHPAGPQRHLRLPAGASAHLLNDGWSVVVDAAFLRRAERDSFAALARGMGCQFHILAPEAPIEELRSAGRGPHAAAQRCIRGHGGGARTAAGLAGSAGRERARDAPARPRLRGGHRGDQEISNAKSCFHKPFWRGLATMKATKAHPWRQTTCP